MTDPDHLKSAAEYLLQGPQPDTWVQFHLAQHSTWPDSRTKHIVARSSEGGRYRKQPKIDALRQYKEEILEAHR